MEENADSSPFLARPDSILSDWAEAHGRLLLEESRLMELCRLLANGAVTADVLPSQRERVASMRELAERLYSEAMAYLGAIRL